MSAGIRGGKGEKSKAPHAKTGYWAPGLAVRLLLIHLK
jgi:hypothetical protein